MSVAQLVEDVFLEITACAAVRVFAPGCRCDGVNHHSDLETAAELRDHAVALLAENGRQAAELATLREDPRLAAVEAEFRDFRNASIMQANELRSRLSRVQALIPTPRTVCTCIEASCDRCGEVPK